ncbi:MAG TPA: Hsp20/alpha crystallin family protein [Bacteroidetes bacterium]|nr:Hsp20/alpha crystallin family protein [Bacteroidota bacterium]
MMSIVKRNPRYNWNLLNLGDEINRLFGGLYSEFDRNECAWAPSVDIVEQEDKLMLNAELPGIEKEDVKISFQNNILTIEGEKKQQSEAKDDDYFRTERFYGKFCRSFTMPSDIDSENISADYSNGVLTVSLPKSEKAKPQQIEIK